MGVVKCTVYTLYVCSMVFMLPIFLLEVGFQFLYNCCCSDYFYCECLGRVFQEGIDFAQLCSVI